MATGVYGALIAWTIAGVGMLMLAFVFQTLANRKPDLDAGVYAYARAGFGPYLGFASAFGYWASACVGNVSYWVLIKSTLGAVFPFFGDGNTISAVAVSSVGIWAFYFLVLRGTKEAAAINKIVTIAKVIPLLLFLVLAIFAFKPDVFAANLWGGTGESFNLYDGAAKRWHQTWVDNGGTLLLLDGGLVDGRMVLSGPGKGPKGEAIINRIAWEKLADGRVRQTWTVSSDGGATWTNAFDGYYAKK
jgi:amino acid transporter